MDDTGLLGPMVIGYFLPAIIAVLRGHPQTGPIAIITIFLGWTGIGWIIALAWSASKTGKEKKIFS